MAGDAFLLLHYFQAPQITARDILEYAESAYPQNEYFGFGSSGKFINWE